MRQETRVGGLASGNTGRSSNHFPRRRPAELAFLTGHMLAVVKIRTCSTCEVIHDTCMLVLLRPSGLMFLLADVDFWRYAGNGRSLDASDVSRTASPLASQTAAASDGRRPTYPSMTGHARRVVLRCHPDLTYTVGRHHGFSFLQTPLPSRSNPLIRCSHTTSRVIGTSAAEQLHQQHQDGATRHL